MEILKHIVDGKPRTVDILRQRMQASGKSQMDISRNTGVAQSVVGRILRNVGLSPTLNTYDKIMGYMDRLGVPNPSNKE